ncbi:MAG: hypothetical protein JWP76_4284 [Dactylosporangium sp.]|nr:hypothetical protein [Dactylosporangium sp.]
MHRQSLLVTFVVLAATGTVLVAVWMLTAKSGLAGRCRRASANAGVPVRIPAAENRRTLERGWDVSAASAPREAGTPGGDARIDRNRQARGCNTLADRGHGYVL